MSEDLSNDPQAIQAEIVAIERGQKAQTQAAIAEAERRAILLGEITKAALARTYPQDWIDFRSENSDEGAPYLSAAGAERLRALFGISITNPETKRYEERDKEGMFFFYVVTAVARWRGDEVSVMGTCSSRDLFFRTRRENGQKILLPSEEIDPTNIMKAARSNMIANAVTGVLGLRGLTWAQLAQYGLVRGEGGTATFRGGAESKRDAKPDGAAKSGVDARPPIEQYEARLREVFGDDEAAINAIVKTYSAFGEKKDAAGKVVRKSFDGWPTLAALKAKSRNVDVAGRIGLKMLNEAIQRGEITIRPKAAETAPPTPAPAPTPDERPDGEGDADAS